MTLISLLFIIILSYSKTYILAGDFTDIMVKIIKITEQDINTVRSIYNVSFGMGDDLEMAVRAFEEYINYFITDGLAFLICEDDEAAGFAVAMIQPDIRFGRIVFVDTIAVVPGKQGRGFGRALIEHVACEARTRGIEVIRLNTVRNIKAYEIYRHMGFGELCSRIIMERNTFEKNSVGFDEIAAAMAGNPAMIMQKNSGSLNTD